METRSSSGSLYHFLQERQIKWSSTDFLKDFSIGVFFYLEKLNLMFSIQTAEQRLTEEDAD